MPSREDGLDIFNVGGIPLHPLLVHAVVVLLPLSALATVLHALRPAARRRLGFVTPLAALIVLGLIPITVAAGESLAPVVGSFPQLDAHEVLGQMLLRWARDCSPSLSRSGCGFDSFVPSTRSRSARPCASVLTSFSQWPLSW